MPPRAQELEIVPVSEFPQAEPVTRLAASRSGANLPCGMKVLAIPSLNCSRYKACAPVVAAAASAAASGSEPG